jgi:6-phosphofructokinase 1
MHPRRDKLGARFSIVVVAEGAHPEDGGVTLIEAAHGGHVERLGGIGVAAPRSSKS